MEGQKTELKMIRMSEVESQEVKWLWYPFIPDQRQTDQRPDWRSEMAVVSVYTIWKADNYSGRSR